MAASTCAPSPGHSFLHSHSQYEQRFVLGSNSAALRPHFSSEVFLNPAKPFANLSSVLRAASPVSEKDEQPVDDLGSLRTDFSSSRRHGNRGQNMWSGRRRGESDLGRPPPPIRLQAIKRPAYAVQQETSGSPRRLPTTPELLSGILLPLPFLFASLAYPSHTSLLAADKSFTGKSSFDEAPQDELSSRNAALVQASALTAITLLIVGLLGRIHISDTVLDRRKGGEEKPEAQLRSRDIFGFKTLQEAVLSAFSVGLPFYASVQLGGIRTALVLLLAASSEVVQWVTSRRAQQYPNSLLLELKTRKFSAGWLVIVLGCEFFGLSGGVTNFQMLAGYLALAASIFILPLPVFDSKTRVREFTPPALASSHVIGNPTPPSTPELSIPATLSRLLPTTADANRMLFAGLLSLLITTLTSIVAQTAPPVTLSSVFFSVLGSFSAVGLFFIFQPQHLQTHGKFGVLAGFGVIALFTCVYHPDSLTIPIIYSAWAGLAYVATLMDSIQARKSVETTGHGHGPHSNHPRQHSKFTAYLLSIVTPGSVAHDILSKKDSRRIAYFASLNLGFMLVQFTYGIVTGSLGLLTDSIHMLFDCVGLAVGLAASVMSKWPPSHNFPYGYGKIDTLSGFANGILLILVCVEIVFDAIHRLHEGAELRRINELLVVSVLGFLVNMMGLIATGHAHAGHDHGHNHAHTSSEEHTAERRPSNSQLHIVVPTSPPPTPFSLPSGSLPSTPGLPPSQGHHHHHHEAEPPSAPGNENMQGIYLHILADTLGSVAVIVSTLLTKYNSWFGWDPVASCIISAMIFVSALPLVRSSGLRLLLALTDDTAYKCKDTLLGLGELRGVVGYSGVRFWAAEGSDSASHGHGHGHAHGHSHGHGHAESCGADNHLHGVVHVFAARGTDLDDVRERTSMYLKGRGVDAIVQVEREGESRCWCGGGANQVRPLG